MNVKEVIFWIFFIISLILLIWYIFGDSPTELITIITIIFTVILKMWNISDRNIKLEMKLNSIERQARDSFNRMKEDIGLIKRKLKI